MTLNVPPPIPSRSTGKKFSDAIGAGLQGAQSILQQYQQQQQMQQENEAIKQNLGVDLNGINDPKQRQILVQSASQGANAREIEGMKQAFKTLQQTQKQDFVSGLIGKRNKDQSSQNDSQQEESSGIDPSQFTDEQILQVSMVDPNAAREMRMAKDAVLKNKKFEFQMKEQTPDVQREKQLTHEQAKADVNYNKELQSAHKQHQIKSDTLTRLEALNKKGVTGKPYEKLLEKFGLISLTSEGRREFAADVKNLITDIRSILGGQFSQFEFQTILNAYPSADFSKGANEAIIKNLKDFQEIRNQEFHIANEIKKENKGKIPEDFQSRVNERLQDYAQTKIKDIKNNVQEIMREQLGVPIGHTILLDQAGEPLAVPNSEVEDAIRNGASMP